MPPSNDAIAPIAAAVATARFGAFSTLRDGAINSRFMVFAADDRLENFYLLTHEATEKVGEVKANSQATLCVLAQPPGTSLDESSELTVVGRTEVSADFGGPWVETGLRHLAKRAPEVQIMLDGRDLGPYRLIRLASDKLVYQTYGGAAARAPKTVVERTK